jgi:O-antigen/teichoic acid export membrane protein
MSALGQREDWESRAAAIWRLAYRYGLTSLGPVAVSGAHFVASVLFLRLLPPADFGHFSFLMIVVPFCLSATGAMLGAPAAMTRGKATAIAEAELKTLLNISLLVSVLAFAAVAAMMASTGASAVAASVFGLYAAVFTARSFARSYANVMGMIERVAASDIIYSLALMAGLAGLAVIGRFTLTNAAIALVAASLIALPLFGRDYVTRLIRALAAPRIKAYRPMWLDVTRWSLLGVVLTEMASNCHAYLVTFISGPGAFGLLALGSLFMRPASLVLGALPDIDQPVMARKIAAGDLKSAFGVVNEFRTAAGAVLVGTVLLALVLVFWFPHLLLKHYPVNDVLVVLAFWVGITALRVVRTPEAVFVMATGGYSKLAWISGVSSVVALALTLVLLLIVGPLWSLGGVLAGEVAMVAMLLPLTNRWRRQIG